jgi:cytidine deaminase
MLNWTDFLSRSYAPYSGRPAACVVKGESGRFYGGVRIENISFPLTINEVQAAVCFCLSEKDHPLSLLRPAGQEDDDGGDEA